MVSRTLLSLLLLPLCVAGTSASHAAVRPRESFCGERGAEYVSAPGVLVPFYLGMASLGVSVVAHVYWAVRRLLSVSRNA
ncbi:envelope glycoprotein N [Macacine alphaherpesvirus 1]|nr:envelope glycoprotein N [Macacine alphaherpesvirus 1]ARS02137.1 envelope glycoprotein N [Macacine alphaherpesvirus 1]ARS02212.1 envelope glycoprotein N [Macacine alphaherpesvirus 1]ARS02287.1 envelope glycoprotein N [Macacine alphaherpesvirus 1]ARS02362.1 envelope glycoprotein N [Macacine alphaherpesvirus 1]